MTNKTILQHVAINYKDKVKADIFFTKILDLKLQKSFSLNSTPMIFKYFKEYQNAKYLEET